jgi:signal recognition particle receptor subunit beta
MQTQSFFTQSHNQSLPHQITHILVAGLWTSDKNSLIRHVCDAPLHHVDLVGDLIPTKLPDLLMGEIQVDSRLTTQIWGAPDHWQHDYVNYLVNIKTILNNRGENHRVLGMMVVIDSLMTASSADESKVVRLIQADWSLPYIIVASHPYASYARHIDTIRESYQIDESIPIIPCDVSRATEAKRALIELMYCAM